MVGLSLLVSLELHALPPLEEIPEQSEQIRTCKNFAEFLSDNESYEKLKKISLKNFKLIGDVVAERFAYNSTKRKEFEMVLKEAKKIFDDEKMTLQDLANVYYRFTAILQNETATNNRDMSVSYREINEVREKINKIPLKPLPILSLDGIAKMGQLCRLCDDGYYYLGIPLAQNVEYDGNRGGARDFFEHDLDHGFDFLGLDKEYDLGKIKRFSKAFNDALIGTAKTLEEKKIVNIIRFLALHETKKALKLNRYALDLDKELSFQKWANSLLIDASALLNKENFPLKELVNYAEQKKLITFPENAALHYKGYMFIDKIQEEIANLFHKSNTIFSYKE